ncbi:MAG: TolC family outer membrane protein [Solimonas sp.]
MRLASWVLAGLLAVPAAANANELLRVFQLAQENDATYQAARFTRDAAVEARPQALAGLLPKIDGNATQNWQRTRITGAGLAGTPESSQPYSYGLTLAQPLFDWSAFRRYAQSGDRVALAETTYRSRQQDLTLRVAQAYFNVLSSADNLRTLDAQNRAVERQLDESHRRFDAGMAAITDVQEAQARYDLTAAQLIEAQQALDAAKEALAEITGQPVVAWVPLQDEIPLPTPKLSANDWVRSALDGNFDLIIAQYNAGIADKDVQIARAGHYPTLSLNAGRNTNEVADFNNGIVTTDGVALQFNLPIYAGGSTQSKIREAKATSEQFKAQALGQQRLAERNTRDAYQGVVTGAAKVKAYRQAVTSNSTALEASETGLQVGTRTTVDVLNAQQALYSAQRDYYKSRYDYLMSFFKLKSSAGQLSDEDLRLVDSLLIQG